MQHNITSVQGFLIQGQDASVLHTGKLTSALLESYLDLF